MRRVSGQVGGGNVVIDMYLYASIDMDSEGILRAVGERMKHERERAGLTQAHVATRMGPEIDQPRISKWESGAAAPNLVQLFTYADICGATPEQLVADIQRPIARQPALFGDLDPPATRLVTNLVSLLHERARLLKVRERREGRRNG